MTIGMTKQVERILPKIDNFLEEELYPLEETFLQKGFQAVLPTLKRKREKVKALGLWAPHLPKELGGIGLTLPEFAHISEALGRSPLGHYSFNSQAPDVGNMEILHQYGTPEQKERFLMPLANGEVRSCFSMTEPEHAGSNPTMMSTMALKDEDEGYVINGHKWFTSGADGASFAIVMAITNPEAESPYQRASQIIVPTDAPGFNHVRRVKIMGEEGEDYMSHSEIRYEDCRVPQDHLLGGEGTGFVIAQQRLGPGRIHHCMRWIGICERAFDLMCQRAATRKLRNSGEVLAHRQTIQHWIAESRAEINASRLMVLDTVDKIEKEGTQAARVEISIIKFYVAGVLHKLIDRAIQVHGALGITEDTVLSFWYRHERGARIYDGADEVHKSVVARRILQDYDVTISL
ncbi:MAG: acyl-CoA dehydrogenase family protein [Chloroflexota bacterium]